MISFLSASRFTELADSAPVEDEDNSCAVGLPDYDVGKSCNGELPDDRAELDCDVWSSTDSESTVITAESESENGAAFTSVDGSDIVPEFSLVGRLLTPCRTRHGSRSCPGSCPRVLARVPVPSVVDRMEEAEGFASARYTSSGLRPMLIPAGAGDAVHLELAGS